MPRLRHTVEQILAKLHEAESCPVQTRANQMAHLQDPVRPCARIRWKKYLSEPNRCPKIR